MEFIEFNRQMQAHVAKLFKDAPRLFVTDVDPTEAEDPEAEEGLQDPG